MPIKQKLTAYSHLIRLNKPIGIFLLLWPTLWALLIASEGKPDLTILIVFILGVFLMRSAGCAINDYADQKFDADVERTRNRPMVTGNVSSLEAISIFLILSLIAFFLVVFFLNKLTLMFSLVAVVLAASYPFTKRLHYLPQVHLGLAFAWAVPMVFVAHTSAFPPQWGWLLFIATLIWTTAYDTIYGMVDRKDDVRIGVKSTAILFGPADRTIIAILQTFVILALISVGTQTDLRYWYFCSLALAALLFFYQQILIYSRRPFDCFDAFLNNNYVGLVIFIGIAASYWLPI
ncbi:MAG: 4-hydroxybenzoate octaprenyltransferase [Gammaproteobacteria bacterium]|nr:4-hydroxybenzoate octaprenyltransferase [Gammaproteobacteria bacterium]